MRRTLIQYTLDFHLKAYTRAVLRSHTKQSAQTIFIVSVEKNIVLMHAMHRKQDRFWSVAGLAKRTNMQFVNFFFFFLLMRFEFVHSNFRLNFSYLSQANNLNVYHSFWEIINASDFTDANFHIQNKRKKTYCPVRSKVLCSKEHLKSFNKILFCYWTKCALFPRQQIKSGNNPRFFLHAKVYKESCG